MNSFTDILRPKAEASKTEQIKNIALLGMVFLTGLGMALSLKLSQPKNIDSIHQINSLNSGNNIEIVSASAAKKENQNNSAINSYKIKTGKHAGKQVHKFNLEQINNINLEQIQALSLQPGQILEIIQNGKTNWILLKGNGKGEVNSQNVLNLLQKRVNTTSQKAPSLSSQKIEKTAKIQVSQHEKHQAGTNENNVKSALAVETIASKEKQAIWTQINNFKNGDNTQRFIYKAARVAGNTNLPKEVRQKAWHILQQFAKFNSSDVEIISKATMQDYNKLHELIIENTKIDTAFFGDSRTLSNNDLAKLGSNFGISSTTSADLASKLNTNAKNLKNIKSFELSYGINDLKLGKLTEEIIQNYKLSIEIIKTNNPNAKITIQAVVPPSFNSQNLKNTDQARLDATVKENITPEKVKELNTKLQALAAQEGVEFSTLIADAVQKANQKIAGGAYSDAVHFKPETNKEIARAFQAQSEGKENGIKLISMINGLTNGHLNENLGKIIKQTEVELSQIEYKLQQNPIESTKQELEYQKMFTAETLKVLNGKLSQVENLAKIS